MTYLRKYLFQLMEKHAYLVMQKHTLDPKRVPAKTFLLEFMWTVSLNSISNNRAVCPVIDGDVSGKCSRWNQGGKGNTAFLEKATFTITAG